MKKSLILLLPFILTGCTSISSTPSSVACEYQGITYSEGERFPAEDGCNTCTCGEDGQVACTELACLPPVEGLCQTADDCTGVELDSSFCNDGAWECVEGECQFMCDITGLSQ